MAVRLIVELLPAAYSNPDKGRAREMMPLRSFRAGNAFTRISLGYVHAISHQISAHYNTPHGLANAILLPRVLRFNERACARRSGELERMLQGNASQSYDAPRAKQCIARIVALTETVGILVNLDEVKQKDFAAIAKEALAEARSFYAVPKVMRKSDVATILKSVSSGSRAMSFILAIKKRADP